MKRKEGIGFYGGKKILALLMPALVLFSCIKEDSPDSFVLPDKSQSGRQTMGFLLGEEVWVNYGEVCFPFAGGCRENLQGNYFTSDANLEIRADRVLSDGGSWTSEDNFYITLDTRYRGVGVYATMQGDELGLLFERKLKGGAAVEYLLADTQPDFRIQITRLDTVAGIVSGEFSGKLFKRVSQSGFQTSRTDSLVVRDGRFDIRMQ